MSAAIATADPSNDAEVTVCDACLTACCWHGLFYCEKYKSAGTVQKTVRELKALNKEHPCYWEEGAWGH